MLFGQKRNRNLSYTGKPFFGSSVRLFVASFRSAGLDHVRWGSDITVCALQLEAVYKYN